MDSNRYHIYSETEWIYPDTEITEYGNKAVLHSARGVDVDFQVLTELALQGGEDFAFQWEELSLEGGKAVCIPQLYQLLPTYVSENSGEKIFTTTNYDEVKDFVTRQAPFYVYDVTKPLKVQAGQLDEPEADVETSCQQSVHDAAVLEAGRAAFWVRMNIPEDAKPGMHEGRLHLYVGEQHFAVDVVLKVYHTVILKSGESAFHMNNWIYYPSLAAQYKLDYRSEEFINILDGYYENLIDMRNDYVMIPSGEPVYDENGKVVDFDFSTVEIVGNKALAHGFKYILGGFVARFKQWDDDDHYLLWDRSIAVTSIEGFCQLKQYFKRAWECVQRNGWEEQYMQCLVDEPQFPNSLAYRALSGICRQNMPAVIINDPVETTEVAGALDVWVVKQATYEQYLEDYKKLQAAGEEMWLYTCGYPAGKMMNRVMDLPLTVSRLTMWLCYKYGCPGFLHWGYHCTPKDGLTDACTPVGVKQPGKKFPAGNAFIVYMGEGNKPWYSVRGHAQRTGAVDYELLYLLGQKDYNKAITLIERLCRSFEDYDGSSELFDAVRVEILETLG